MTRQIAAGQYQLELDGQRLIIRDGSGQIVETIDDINSVTEIRLPNGSVVQIGAIADAFADPSISEIQTAAGGSDATGAPNSGAIFTPFATAVNLGGLTAVGAQDGTSLAYSAPVFPEGRTFSSISGADVLSPGAEAYAPTAQSLSLVTREDGMLSAAGKATDPENDPLLYTLVDAPTHGTIAFQPDGTFTYRPDLNYNGADSFTYRANDGGQDSNVAAVSVTVIPVNDAPVAADNAFTTAEDTTFAGAVQGTDVEHDPLTYVIVDGPQHGAIEFDADGSFVYKPDADYSGTDSFTYRVNDGSDDSNVAKVDITVTPVNDAPVADDAALIVNEDTAASGVTQGHDPEGDKLAYAVVEGPQHGSLQFNADGSYAYTPADNYNGTDNFTYRVNDGSDDSNVATVAILVNPINDAPVAADGAIVTNEDTSAPGQSSATDVDSPALNYEVVAGPAHGTIDFKADGSFIYKPDANYSGQDSFTYRANDGATDSNLARVDITVKPVNDAPVLTTTDGQAEVHVININNAAGLDSTYAIGAYLASAGKESQSINPKFLNGVSTGSVTLTESHEVKVNFLSEGAGYRNMVGTYTFDESGKIDPASVKLVWLDSTAVKENVSGAALTKDFLGNSQPSSISLGQMPAGTQVGFFIVADGASNAANKSLLGSVAGVKSSADSYQTDLDAINQALGVKIDANGNAHITVNGTALSGDTYFTSNTVLNTDANSNDMIHAISGVTKTDDSKLIIGFEDLSGGGDKDYNDTIFTVDVGAYNINKLTQSVAQPTVHIQDIDSANLSEATIASSGFQAGDHLNVPASSLFDVSVTTTGNDTTIHVEAKSGAESIASFESFLNGIYFSSTSTEEGGRTLHYSVTDAEGAQSNLGDAHVALTTSYEVSASELGNHDHLGSGNDILYLNEALNGQVDMGAGKDSVHLAQDGMGFGHSDVAHIQSAEVIDATGYGNNVIKLSVGDVNHLTDDSGPLTVVGNAGDSVHLVNEGVHTWQVTAADADFTTLTFDNGVHQAVIVVSNELELLVA